MKHVVRKLGSVFAGLVRGKLLQCQSRLALQASLPVPCTSGIKSQYEADW